MQKNTLTQLFTAHTETNTYIQVHASTSTHTHTHTVSKESLSPSSPFFTLYLYGFPYVKLKADVVNGDGVFASVVLADPCEERLREVEPREPENAWGSIIDPVLDGTHTHTHKRQWKSNSVYWRLG